MAGYKTFLRVQPGDAESPSVQFLGGIAATLTQSLVMVPLEVVRQRQQVQTAVQSGGGAGGAAGYSGSLQTAALIARVEGPRALFRGFGVTQVRLPHSLQFLSTNTSIHASQMVWAPFNAVFLPLWEGGKRLGVRVSGCGTLDQLPVQWELASSFLASALAAAISNPADVVKTRLQVAGASNVAASVPFRSARHAASDVYAREGWLGFTRGMGGRVLWVAPSTCIMFTAFDGIMKRL